jgi:hypothetical protein
MNTFARLLSVESLSGPKVRYYTLALQDSDDSWARPESESFFLRHESIDRLADMLDEIFTWLEEMANVTGARPEFFRNERYAHALPPEQQQRARFGKRLEVAYKEQNNLRLYVIRLNSHVVILLNGGEKTARNPEDCPSVRAHFLKAQRIAKAIDEALDTGDIRYNKGQTDIVFDQDFELTIS